MSKQVLEVDFGNKLYDKFPKVYRELDVDTKFVLQRYLQALGEGGFDYIIEKTNELLTLYDYAKVDKDILPYIFDSFGLPIFNGIPEVYLRNLLTIIGDLFERKGNKEVVEYLTSIVSGVKSSIDVSSQGSRREVLVTLELDYDSGNKSIPDKEQIQRIINEFIPFYCYIVVIYSYIFIEEPKLKALDNAKDFVSQQYTDGVLDDGDVENATFGSAIFGSAVFGKGNNVTIIAYDEYTDVIITE